MGNVNLEQVWKIYPGDIEAVKDFTLDIRDGEFLVLVGPSGCGKSTTLRMVAGLEEITRGRVTISGRVVNDVPPKDRDIAMVFQNYALYPHMSVYDNMAFGLKLRKYKKSDIKARVMEAAEILGIEDLLNRRPKALSGGQRQRVAVGRAIVRKPDAFLFDEPLSNLDAKMRVQMRAEINRLHHHLETTMIYVTHDQVEAMTMGDRIVVMKDGFIQQVAEPIELYDNPSNTFVAGFIGTPPMNFFHGSLRCNPGKSVFAAETFSMPIPPEWDAVLQAYNNKAMILGIRPENIGSNAAENMPDCPKIGAMVDVMEPMGSETYLYMKTGDQSFIARVDSHRPCRVGAETDLAVMLQKAHLFDPESTQRVV